MDMKTLMGDQDHIAQNLFAYIRAFSPSVLDSFERFDFYTQIDRLAKNGLLYQVTEKFARIDLHPEVVSNTEMGHVFEELIRKFAETSNETAGEHFTPREVIPLMVNLLFVEDDDLLSKPGVVRTIYDPAAGTGGILSVDATVKRLTYAQPVCEVGFASKRPPVQTAIAGLQIADTSFYYPEDRSISESVRFGREMAKAIRGQ
jgi:type I restriction-modification system DNA methylase subunit